MGVSTRCYVYLIKDGVSALYVGKGTGRRGNQSAKKHGGQLVILEDGLTDDQAFAAERKWIAELQPANNVLPGGNGGRSTPRRKSKELIAWERQLAEIERVGSRKYVAQFLAARLNEANCAAWNVSKVDLLRLREVAHG